MVNCSLHLTRRWGLALLLMFLSSVSYGEGFYSYYLHQTGERRASQALVCVDSLPNVDRMSQCVVDQYSLLQRKYTSQLFVNKAGQWKAAKGATNTSSVSEQERSFVAFILQFSKNKEFQINHTIFPLPVTTVGTTPKKKLVMPRDWEQIDFVGLFSTFHFIQPSSSGNNRKFYVFKDGKKTELYNFIYINHQWYFIEKEIYE